ncbi:MAG: hypothetical protein JXX28_07395 [Deltaproteobacteria bacterium]|nr:hypothetical protein [Deltaproteobacteria bacterium]
MSAAADPELVALVGRLRHDLGRYMAFQLRAVGDGAPHTLLCEALRADLLQTRRGPAGVERAVDLWDRALPALERSAARQLQPFEDLRREMERVRSCTDLLERGALSPPQALAGRKAALAAADALRALHTRLREA